MNETYTPLVRPGVQNEKEKKKKKKRGLPDSAAKGPFRGVFLNCGAGPRSALPARRGRKKKRGGGGGKGVAIL